MAPLDSDRDAVAFFRVRTPEQARMLTDSTAVRFLEPFLGRERTASQAAEEIAVSVDTMLYRIRTFLSAGLVEIVREQPRAGRPMKVYRTVADGFFVPFALTAFAGHEDQMREQLRADEDAIVRAGSRALRRVGEEGRRIYRNADGEVFHQSAGELGKAVEWMDPRSVREAPGPAFEMFGARLALTDAQSRDLLVDLYQVYERFHAIAAADQSERRAREFLFRFQVAAVDERT